MFKVTVLHQSTKSRARVCQIETAHGTITTPSFVPVATNACMKSFDSMQLAQLDVDLLFCNTYHLLLHPGPDVVSQAGGLHTFMQRKKPIITDSGGFQIFSLMYGGVTEEIKSKGGKTYNNNIKSINEEGVVFRSYRDGSMVKLTPERSVQIQKQLGADIIIPLDELLPYHATPERVRSSLERTHRWERRSLEEHRKNPLHQSMYGVVHGGIDSELRKRSCQLLVGDCFDGYAIGGSVGKNVTEMVSVLEASIPFLPDHAPRHLLGIGDIPSISALVHFGIDTFDSAYPTKCARHGTLFSDNGPVKIQQSKWKNCFEPFSQAPGCENYSAAYLHHLFKAHEQVGAMLASIHNTWYMTQFMNKIRELIMNNEL